MHVQKHFLAFFTITLCSLAMAQADYHRLEFEIDIDRPAAEVWSKVGDYCDISDWLGVTCEITQGDGGLGTVRVLNGTIVEPLVGQTELSYGYTQPPVEGVPYNLYHGFMEARPVTDSTSKMIYRVMWDRSNEDETTFQANVERRTNLFTGGLEKIKEIAESD